LAYYTLHFQDAFKNTWEMVSAAPCNLVWVNIMPKGIRVMNQNGHLPAEPLEIPLELPERLVTEIAPILGK